jgi:hypothetical protein
MPASPQEHRPKFTMFKNHPAHPYGTPRELLRESVSAAERHYGIAYPTFRPRQGSILDIDYTRATPLRLKILIEVCEDDDNHCYYTEEPRYCCQGHCHQSAYEFTMDVDASLRAPDMIRPVRICTATQKTRPLSYYGPRPRIRPTLLRR